MRAYRSLGSVLFRTGEDKGMIFRTVVCGLVFGGLCVVGAKHRRQRPLHSEVERRPRSQTQVIVEYGRRGEECHIVGERHFRLDVAYFNLYQLN